MARQKKSKTASTASREAKNEPEVLAADETQVFTMDDLKKIIPDEHHRNTLLRFLREVNTDPAAMATLKGHLVIEERLTAALEKFVFHPEHLKDSRLTFAQKLTICRAVSLDQNKNSIWSLIGKLNKLRNTLSHSLSGQDRKDATNALRDAYSKEVGTTPARIKDKLSKERKSKLETWERTDHGLVSGVVALCLGFVVAFEQEIERFKDYVNLLDIVVNPHRHKNKLLPPKKQSETKK